MNIQEAINVSRRGVKRGGVEMFRVADAISIVEECRRRKKPILGLDAFLLTDFQTQPILEKSVDLSTDKRFVGKTHTAAIEHLKKFEPEDIWFEVVY